MAASHLIECIAYTTLFPKLAARPIRGALAAEDKVEVLERREANAGRDPFPKLVRKCKLPRAFAGVDPLGVSPDDISDYSYLRDTDLRVGSSIDVFGRPLFLYDCDGFTRQYYSRVHGFEQPPSCLRPDELIEFPTLEEPPYTGIGDEADSIAAFYTLAPRTVKAGAHKRQELSDVVFRWKARLDVPAMDRAGPDDAKRRFIVSFYLLDSTVAIYEPPVINSGFLGGKFLERQRLLRRGARKTDSLYVGAEDLLVPLPATVWLNSYPFVLLECDGFTRRYLSRGGGGGPPLDEIHEKLRRELGARAGTLAAELRTLDVAGDGRVGIDGFVQALRGAGAELDDDELLTLVQHWDAERDGTVRHRAFVDAITAPP